MDDEQLDLVNDKDDVIGTINRLDYRRLVTEKIGYIRAVNLFIVNGNGQIYAPTRTAHKTIAPNGYDYSAAGHVAAGEDYLSAIIREADEELHITISAPELSLVGKGISHETRYIYRIYVLHRDQTPVYNPDDFAHAEWLQPAEIIQNITAGHPAKADLTASIGLLQSYLKREKVQ